MDTKEFGEEKRSAGKTISYWIDSTKPIIFAPLAENLETDVVIVGGGISGLTIAYTLASKGKQVVLVEDGYIGSGETGRTTAHLTAALDDRYYEIEKIHGADGAKLAAQSHVAAINYIEEIVKKENIDCGFERVNGYLFLHPTDKEKNLDKEFDAAKKAGFRVEMLDRIPGITSNKGRSIKYPDQAQFHAMKYLQGLSAALEKMGVKIFTETHAAKIDHEGIETTAGFKVKAQHVVIATNSPVNDLFVIHSKQGANRTYAIGARVKKGSVPKNLWWDTGDQELPEMPYHYARVIDLNDEHDLLITGGEDHAIGHTENTPEENRFIALENWTREHFPATEDIIYKWSGQVMEPMDGLAFIGRNPLDKDNVYIVTGDSGNGLTHGTIAGILIPDLILGKKNKWEKLYNPSRFKIFHAETATEFFRNSFEVMLEYLKDIPGVEDISKVENLPHGEGEVIQADGEKLAVYRDSEDQLHVLSAVCPHLQCIVKWNNEEKSWDCPCHGSRFTATGKVMNGPANSDLGERQFSEKDINVNH